MVAPSLSPSSPKIRSALAVIALAMSASAFASRQKTLPSCATARGMIARTVVVLPEDLPAQEVAAGLSYDGASSKEASAVCAATPERLVQAIRTKKPRAVVYLRPRLSTDLDRDLAALPPRTQLVSYRPLVSGWQRHTSLAVPATERLSFYGRFLGRSTAPLVVLADRPVPRIHAKATVVSWQELDLAALCASGSQILALIAPIRIQQLAHRLAHGQVPVEGQTAAPSRPVTPCRSNWYFTSAARTRTTLAAVMKAVQARQLRAYVLDAIGYYRKQPKLIAALGLPALSETPDPRQSRKIRSLYYTFSAIKAAQRSGNTQGSGSPRMRRAFVFRVLGTGLVLDRTIR